MRKLSFPAAALRLSMTTALVLAPVKDILAQNCVLPVQVPPQAQAKGFTTLAFDGDMTKGFDVGCSNPASENHQWYLGQNRVMAANCANLTYPHTDETDGSTVLDVHLGPSTNDGGIEARVGISTSDFFTAHNTNFPINAYYECTIRFDSYSISHTPLWSNCSQGDTNTANNSVNSIEYDFTEFHGGYQRTTEVAGNINWACGGSGAGCAQTGWFGDPASKIPGYDPAQFHKYAALQYQTGPNTIHIAAYVDDVLMGEGDATLTNTPGGSTPDPNNLKQRNSVHIDLTGGCKWDEGGVDYCQNLGVTNVFADANGNTRVAIPNIALANEFPINIQGVTGVTSPISGDFGQTDGNWAWWLSGMQCTDANGNVGAPCSVQILTSPFGSPIHFSGTYTGGGIVNKWVDPGMHVYVKSFRVWACSNWKTTECSTYNPN